MNFRKRPCSPDSDEEKENTEEAKRAELLNDLEMSDFSEDDEDPDATKKKRRIIDEKMILFEKISNLQEKIETELVRIGYS